MALVDVGFHSRLKTQALPSVYFLLFLVAYYWYCYVFWNAAEYTFLFGNSHQQMFIANPSLWVQVNNQKLNELYGKLWSEKAIAYRSYPEKQYS